MNTRIRSALVALALGVALAIPGAALAESSSGTMTLSVGQAITVSGVPTTIDFGSSLGDETKGATPFDVTYAGNTAYSVSTTAADLTATGGLSILKADIHLDVDGTDGAADGRALESFTATGGSGSKTLTLSIDVPAAQGAGAYSGQFVVNAN
jgi:hypothetical protein